MLKQHLFYSSWGGAPWNCPISGSVGCQQRPRQDWQWSNASLHSSCKGAPWSCPISGWVRCKKDQGTTDDGATVFMAAEKGHRTGATPFYLAAAKGHLEVVRFLVESGANNKDQGTTENGTTPLCIAAQNGHLEVVRFLLESSANKDQGSDWQLKRVTLKLSGRLQAGMKRPVEIPVSVFGANGSCKREGCEEGSPTVL